MNFPPEDHECKTPRRPWEDGSYSKEAVDIMNVAFEAMAHGLDVVVQELGGVTPQASRSAKSAQETDKGVRETMIFPPKDHECKPREPWELGWYSKRYVDGTNVAFDAMAQGHGVRILHGYITPQASRNVVRAAVSLQRGPERREMNRGENGTGFNGSGGGMSPEAISRAVAESSRTVYGAEFAPLAVRFHTVSQHGWCVMHGIKAGFVDAYHSAPKMEIPDDWDRLIDIDGRVWMRGGDDVPASLTGTILNRVTINGTVWWREE
jgi:hypothetical protein